MSIGQFVPPPLDGVSEVIDILHPFHLHCILVDIWNYVRDNVPSPGKLSFKLLIAYNFFCDLLLTLSKNVLETHNWTRSVLLLSRCILQSGSGRYRVFCN